MEKPNPNSGLVRYFSWLLAVSNRYILTNILRCMAQFFSLPPPSKRLEKYSFVWYLLEGWNIIIFFLARLLLFRPVLLRGEWKMKTIMLIDWLIAGQPEATLRIRAERYRIRSFVLEFHPDEKPDPDPSSVKTGSGSWFCQNRIRIRILPDTQLYPKEKYG